MKQVFVAAAILLLPFSASAQQRPLVTEDPETIGEGRILTEFGFDYGKDVSYPASGLEGNLLRLPLIGVSVGVSSIAEVQIDGGFYNRLSITERFDAPLSVQRACTMEEWRILLDRADIGAFHVEWKMPFRMLGVISLEERS